MDGGNSGIGVETVSTGEREVQSHLAAATSPLVKLATNMYTAYDIDAEELDFQNDLAWSAFADRVATVDLPVLNAGIMALNQKEPPGRFEKQIE